MPSMADAPNQRANEYEQREAKNFELMGTSKDEFRNLENFFIQSSLLSDFFFVVQNFRIQTTSAEIAQP